MDFWEPKRSTKMRQTGLTNSRWIHEKNVDFWEPKRPKKMRQTSKQRMNSRENSGSWKLRENEVWTGHRVFETGAKSITWDEVQQVLWEWWLKKLREEKDLNITWNVVPTCSRSSPIVLSLRAKILREKRSKPPSPWTVHVFGFKHGRAGDRLDWSDKL